MEDVRELVSYISKAERGYTKLLNRAFQKSGYDISREQYEVLQVLWNEDRVNQQFIADKVEKDKYNITKLLNTLTKHGYVRRIICRIDKRNNYVVLTDRGREVQDALNKIESQLHTDLTLTIPTEEIKSCLWELRKFTDMMT